MGKSLWPVLICAVIMFFTSHMAFAIRTVATGGIESWLVAAVPDTGAANAEGIITDWIKKNIGISEEDLSKPENGPKAGDKLTGDPRFDWKVIKSDAANNHIVDFQRADIFGAHDFITAYMYLYIISDEDRRVDMWFGSDDSIKVWVNGKVIHNNPVLRGIAPNQDHIKGVPLKQGKNGLLIKICEQTGGWAGWCRIDPVDGLKATPDPRKAAAPLSSTGVIYFNDFLNLIGPSPGGAVAAVEKDLISEWTDHKYTEEDVANGKGVENRWEWEKFPLVEQGAEGWKLGEFTDFSGNNVQKLAEEVFGRVGDLNNYTWYGYTVIISPDRRNVDLRVGSDDAVKVWLNGKVVHDNPVLRGSSGFQDRVPITLKPGPNRILVKVCEQGGGWAVFIGFDNEKDFQGLKVDASKTIGFQAVDPIGKLRTTWGSLKDAR
ncbi:hypothetical protein J7M22_09645 [Candidatus Poribacteria bacterium]|nr:hypothetical protein [Candidatus Poribacteria bacterium]